MAKEKSEDTQEQSEATEVQAEEQTKVEEELTEEQVVEQVSQLTEEVVEEKVQEETQTETETEQTEQVTEEVQAEIPIIDSEMIKDYPVLRSYYGKPITDVAPAYQRIVSQFTQNSQELKKLKQQMAESSLQKTDDMPDPVDKPEEFKQWLKDFAKKNQEVGAQEKVEPQIDVMSELAKRLPPDTDVQKVTQEWMNENAERLYDEMGNFRPEIESLYQRNPEILYAEVIKFNQKYEKENQDEAVERKAGHKKLKTDFKKARNSKKEMPGAQVNTISKDVKLTPEEEMLIEINELVQE